MAQSKEEKAVSDRERYQNNKEEIAINKKEYYQNNKKDIAAKGKEYRQTIEGKYNKLKLSAKRRQLKCEISKEHYEEYFYQQPCFYCGTVSNGIDRVDSSKGYVDGNCLPCCKTCNLMKRTDSFNDFIEHIGRMYRHLS